MPIYEDPNHRFYGPSRRLYLILMQLFGDELPALEEAYSANHGQDWTSFLEIAIGRHGMPEGHTARNVIREFDDLAAKIEIAASISAAAAL